MGEGGPRIVGMGRTTELAEGLNQQMLVRLCSESPQCLEMTSRMDCQTEKSNTDGPQSINPFPFINSLKSTLCVGGGT